MKGERHPAVTGMEGTHPPKHTTHSGKPQESGDSGIPAWAGQVGRQPRQGDTRLQAGYTQRDQPQKADRQEQLLSWVF